MLVDVYEHTNDDRLDNPGAAYATVTAVENVYNIDDIT